MSQEDVEEDLEKFIRQHVVTDIKRFARRGALVDVKKLILGLLIVIFLATVSFSNSYQVAAYSNSNPEIAAALFNKSNDVKIIWLFTLTSILFMAASIASEYSLKAYGKIYFIGSTIFLIVALILGVITIVGTLNPQDITDDIFFSTGSPSVWYTASTLFIAIGSIAFMVSVYLAYRYKNIMN